MTLAMLSLAVSVVTGLLVVEVFWDRDRRGWSDLALKAFLGAGLGPALGGMLAFAVTLAVGFRRGAIVGADLAALAALAVLAWRGWRRREKGLRPLLPAGPEGASQKRGLTPFPPGVRWGWVIALLVPLALLLAAQAVAFATVSRMLPEGGWDAWAFWNLRAKHLVELPPAEWRRAFEATPGFIGYHPGYPPMFPFAVARAWAWGATESNAVTLALAALYTLATAGVLVTALWRLASPAAALMAGVMFLGTPNLLRLSAWRMADMPLGFLILAAVAMMALAESRSALTGRNARPTGLLVLVGLSCGLASLTKNEGILFLAAAVVAWAVMTWWKAPRETRTRQIVAFALGLAIPAALLVYFKTQLDPGVDYLGPEGSRGPLPFWSAAKHVAILKGLAMTIFPTDYWSAFPWAAAAVLPLLGVRWNAGVRRAAIAGLLILGLIVLGYYAVYATTRHDVEWLISTTLFRLFMHVAPLAVFLLFLLVRAPEERWGDADVSGKSSGGARHRGAT